MSKYTTEVRFICESKAGLTESAGFNSIDQIVESAAPYIFNFDFPIFDETYRLPLEKRILKNFYTREICEETVGLWQLRLENKLNLIMPYYNKLYESELIKFNPLYDVDYNDDHTRKNDDVKNSSTSITDTGVKNGSNSSTKNSSGKSDETENNSFYGNASENETKNNDYKEDVVNSTSKNGTQSTNKSTTEEGSVNNDSSSSQTKNNWDLFSDTPQSGVTGIFNAGAGVSDNAYLTNARNQFENNASGQTNAENRNITTDEDETIENRENGNSITGKNSNNQENSETNKIENKSENRIKGNVMSSEETNENEYSETNTDNRRSAENTVIGSLEDYTQHVYGKRGTMSYSKMITEFRETFLKIDEMILNELSILFFGLW